MAGVVIALLRIVIVLGVLGLLAVQVLLMPVVWRDLAGEEPLVQWAVPLLGGAFALCLQVIGVCVWRLLTFVRRGAVFTERSFRPVDVVIGAVLCASAIVLSFALLLAPGDAAPGLVALVCGAALVLASVALVVGVMRALLRQAVAMRTELEQVI
jgi:hypothetical protein